MSAPIKLSPQESNKEARRFISNIDPANRRSLGRKFLSNDFFEVLPGVIAFDVKLRTALVELSERVAKAFPKSEIGDDGWGRGPIVSDFSELKTLPGSVRVPLSFDFKDDKIKLSPYEKKRAQEVVNAFTEYYFASPGLIAKDSSSGAPLFTQDQRVKQMHLSLLSKNMPYLYSLIGNERNFQPEQALNDLKICFVSTTQIRTQCDVWKDGKVKDRPFLGFDAAFLSQSFLRKPVDMLKNGLLALKRTRKVVAKPGGMNNLLSQLFEGFKNAMYKLFPLTFKHRTPEEVIEKISKYRFVANIDISKFDANQSQSVYMEILDMLPLDEETKFIIRQMVLSPIFISDGDGKGTAWISERWDNKEYSTWCGQPSGIFFTTFWNNLLATFYTIMEYDEFLKDFSVKDILNHKAPIAFLISGDNAIHMSNIVNVAQRVFENKFVEFGLQEGVNFLGVIYYKEADTIKYAHNLSTFFTKTFIPEKEFTDSKFRPFPGLGLLMREQVHSILPNFEEAKKIADDVCLSRWGWTLTQLTAELGAKDIAR